MPFKPNQTKTREERKVKMGVFHDSGDFGVPPKVDYVRAGQVTRTGLEAVTGQYDRLNAGQHVTDKER